MMFDNKIHSRKGLIDVAIRCIPMHLYLSLEGEQSQTQISVIANLLKSDPTQKVLIGGGWCCRGGYKPQDGPETFSPDYLSRELRERGVGRECICAFRKEQMPRFWWMNVVSTWGEDKQMHLLLRSIVDKGQPVKLQFVGVRSHMKRAVWLWRCYNALMRLFGCGLDLEYEIVEIENKMGDDWAKGEGFRNLIAFIDPFGIGPALLIHILRRWQARGAYMCD